MTYAMNASRSVEMIQTKQAVPAPPPFSRLFDQQSQDTGLFQRYNEAMREALLRADFMFPDSQEDSGAEGFDSEQEQSSLLLPDDFHTLEQIGFFSIKMNRCE